jgi:hypothetical protein
MIWRFHLAGVADPIRTPLRLPKGLFGFSGTEIARALPSLGAAEDRPTGMHLTIGMVERVSARGKEAQIL